MKKIIIQLALIILCFSIATSEAKRKKKPRFKPYAMVESPATEMELTISKVQSNLKANGFELLGQYSPYESVMVMTVTNDDLLKAASQSEFGGYGAVVRVAITQAESGIQVSYVNPVYMSFVYQMASLSNVVSSLEQALGKAEMFGSKKGLTKRSLKGYQYMMMMPEFEDHDELGSFDNHETALATVNQHLASGKLPLTKVFEIKIPGKNEVLIGVGIKEGDGADDLIMKTIDVGEQKHSAHLPYAVLISENKVYSQAGKFRIALAFPDLGMGQFMDISDAPDGIKNSLKALTQ